MKIAIIIWTWISGLWLLQGSELCLANETIEDRSLSQPNSLSAILKLEADGQAVHRATLIKSSSNKISPNRSQAQEMRWQAGELEIEGKWFNLPELDAYQQSTMMQRYYTERGDTTLDRERHRQMAKWSHSNKLPNQAEAHWYGVLDSDPNDLEARLALRYTQIQGRWFSFNEISQLQAKAKEQAKTIREWLPKVRDIVTGIENGTPARRLQAVQQLKAVKDPNAILALQFAAERTKTQTASHLLNALKRFQTKEACMALASIAVNNSTTELGQEAALALRRFPKEMFVPALLDFMSTEKDLRRNLVTEPNGDLVLQLLEVRELKSHVETAQLDKILKINNSGAASFGINSPFANRGAPNESISSSGAIALQGSTIVAATDNQVASAVTQNEAERDADLQQARLDQENEQTRQTQRSVCTVLRISTWEKLDDSPALWWNWWDLEQEILTVGNKEILSNYDRNFQSLVYSVEPQRTPIFQATGSTERPSAPTFAESGSRITPSLAQVNPGARHDCLAAGTMIQTERGLRPIETIQIGDNLVSQNIATGAISLKPVLRTSQRPPSITVSIVLSNKEKIQATLGHHWWVIGKGWIKTKDLQAGMQIRTASSYIEVTKLEDAEDVTTYNLSVADNHTYFVGAERLLSYDSNELIPTLQIVPGVSASPLFEE